MKTYVLFHGGCWDGLCAAWIAKSVLPPDTEFIPVQYGQPMPDMVCDSTVYILDFSYKRQEMRCLLSQMHKVVVLDHHATAQAELAGLVDEFIQRPDLINNIPGSELPIIHFDMEKSGGRLAWEHFHPNIPRVNWLVDFTEDRDLWRWKLRKSREINAALRSYPMTFLTLDGFERLIPVNGCYDQLETEGEAILRREKQIVDEHVKHAREVDIAGHKVLAVNATVLFSEIAGELAKGRPFGACYFDTGDGKRVWSLRSTKEGVDVSEVAKTFGGGGHKPSAGFTTKVNEDMEIDASGKSRQSIRP